MAGKNFYDDKGNLKGYSDDITGTEVFYNDKGEMKGYSDDITGNKMYYDDKGRLRGYEVKIGENGKKADSVQGWGASWRTFEEAPISYMFGWIWRIACCAIPLIMMYWSTKKDDVWTFFLRLPITIVVEVVLSFTLYIWLRCKIEEAEFTRRGRQGSDVARSLKNNSGKIFVVIYIILVIVGLVLRMIYG